MSNRRIISRLISIYLSIATLAVCQPAELPSQGARFSSLMAQDGTVVKKSEDLSFPKDHLAHPEYGIEWWYLTANLKDVEQNALWMQWTVFRECATHHR